MKDIKKDNVNICLFPYNSEILESDWINLVNSDNLTKDDNKDNRKECR